MGYFKRQCAPALMSLGMQNAYAGHFEKAVHRLERATIWAPVVGEQPICQASLAIAKFSLDGSKPEAGVLAYLIKTLEAEAKEDNMLYDWAIASLHKIK